MLLLLQIECANAPSLYNHKNILRGCYPALSLCTFRRLNIARSGHRMALCFTKG